MSDVSVVFPDYEAQAVLRALREAFTRASDIDAGDAAVTLLRAMREPVAADRLEFDVRMSVARANVLREMNDGAIKRAALDEQAAGRAALSTEEWETVEALRAGKAKVQPVYAPPKPAVRPETGESATITPPKPLSELLASKTGPRAVENALKKMAATGDDKF